MSSFKIINPYSQKVLETFSYESLKEVESTLFELHQGFSEWKHAKTNKKQTLCELIAQALNDNLDEFATMISTDMGKPITEARAEIKKSIECCNYYKDNVETINNQQMSHHTIRQPLGIILGILPWNYPLWQIIRYLIPALIVGNTCLIKPAFNTFRIAKKLVDCLNNTTPMVVNVCIPTDKDIEALIAHPKIAGVSFTGSVKAGQHVGSLATKELKPCVLELGGSDPFIVFDSADLDEALSHAVKARFTNAGQVCIAAKRFLFQKEIYSQCLDQFKEKLASFLNYGDPVNESTTIGPLSRIDIKQQLENQLKRAKITTDMIVYKADHKLESENSMTSMIIDGTSLTNESPLLTEEIFGPIAVCQPFDSIEDAIKKANATRFGLAASVWTTNKNQQKECIEKIETGTIGINSMVRSNVNTPFGGWKKSGLGVELGIEGALSFTKFKAIQ